MRNCECCCSNGGANGHTDCHSTEAKKNNLKEIYLAFLSFILLIVGISLDNLAELDWFSRGFRLVWYILAYLPVGIPVMKSAIRTIKKGDFFSEFFLMTIATLGAFYIGEYPEGVAVMLFYTIGEYFQGIAVKRSRESIKKLLRSKSNNVILINEKGDTYEKKAEEISIGSIIRLRAGDLLSLDGILVSKQASFNVAALTGESVPVSKNKGDKVLAGMLNVGDTVEVKVVEEFQNSQMSKLLYLVEKAIDRKAPTEKFIRKFAKIYTPIVVLLAIFIVLVPTMFDDNYSFDEWLYRALIFLVVSCPCALVVSIPLGYFGGIGMGSKKGILFKGGDYIDVISEVKTLVTDKTGTLTEGVFEVQTVEVEEKNFLFPLIYSLEKHSSHPIARAITDFISIENSDLELEDIREIPGKGLIAKKDGKTLSVGNLKLIKEQGISYDSSIDDIVETVVAIGYDGKFMGYFVIADKVKKLARESITELKSLGIETIMLSGDKDLVVQKVAKDLGIGEAHGDLMPEDKVNFIERLKSKKSKIAFVGDGFNDAPVIAMSDVGIAMGGVGSDITVETADVIIQDDNPIKLSKAIRIARKTKNIVWQNIAMAIGFKIIALLLGSLGMINMWIAVFADVGVALLAILNSVRIQKIKF